MLAQQSLKVPKPCELRHSIRILQLYKPKHTRAIVPVMFDSRCEIIDDVLGCHAKGLLEIQHYFDDFEAAYEDVYITGVHCFPDDCVQTKWVRTCRDGTQLCGYDHLVMKDERYTFIRVRMDYRRMRMPREM
jgi:hypothetical protein